MNTPKYIIVHHSSGTAANPLADTSHHTVEIINEWHKQQFNFKSSLGSYVGYQYVIERDGKVTQCRADNEAGAHTIGRNNDSIGILVIGNFDVTLPTDAQVTSLRKLLIEKSAKYHILPENIVPHRKFANKTCYGKLLSDTWAADLVEDDEEPAPSHMMLQDMKRASILLRDAEAIINKYL